MFDCCKICHWIFLKLRKKELLVMLANANNNNYRGSPLYAHFETWKKTCYMKLVLVGLYCGPILMLIPPLTRTKAKNRVSGNRVSDFHVSGGPPVFSLKMVLGCLFEWKWLPFCEFVCNSQKVEDLQGTQKVFKLPLHVIMLLITNLS